MNQTHCPEIGSSSAVLNWKFMKNSQGSMRNTHVLKSLLFTAISQRVAATTGQWNKMEIKSSTDALGPERKIKPPFSFYFLRIRNLCFS
ncbi:hypothetical protein HNR39_001843 [Glaciimonas immobilis]|uniref:Uncharacterized protein n=1 Tax=Glaciimonas immobilis TaxID=728004 RepID=A0A840RTT1_9BURK|nr:hypothetical protein [Glaciimonas immobilis]